MSSSFIVDVFSELYKEDGLLVLAPGLGLNRVISKFLQYYSSAKAAKKLVFCLNTVGDEDSLLSILLSSGVKPTDLPKVLTNETLTAERAEMYAEGGCFIVTSRILIIDLLKEQVDPKRVSGMLVCNAHKVGMASIETFIIRIFKQGNRDGFIKGFTDNPDNLVSGFAKVDRLLKNLFCKKLYLWPRFHMRVSQQLSVAPPEVIELTQPLTHHMKAIQAAILVAMRVTINELKKATPHLHTDHLNLEMGISRNLDIAIKAQLDPEWHNLSMRTKDLVQDLTTLRKTLELLLRYDAVTFYSYLRMLHAGQNMQQKISMWITSAAGDTIFERSKWRVLQVLSPDEAAQFKQKPVSRGRERVSLASEKADKLRQALKLKHELKGYIEVPPKWLLLMDVMKEIRTEYADKKAAKKAQDGYDERILILVKETRSAMEITECLSSGPQVVLMNRYNNLVGRQCTLIRERISSKKRVNKTSSNAPPSRGFITGQQQQQQRQQELSQRQQQAFPEGGADAILAESNLTLSDVKKLSTDDQLLVCEEIALRDNSIVAGKKRGHSVHETSSVSSSSRKRAAPFQPSSSNPYGRPNNPIRNIIEDNEEIFESSTNTGCEDREAADAITLEGNMQFAGLDAEVKDLEDLHVVILTTSELEQHSDFLTDYSPSRVILFDPDVSTVRTLELHQAELNQCQKPFSSAGGGTAMKIYFLMYKGSVEEHRYVAALDREKRSFEKLIDDKATMVISLPDFSDDLSREEAADRSLTLTDTRGSSSSSSKKASKRVIVDLREFRSSLPSLLHSSGLEIIPETLVVGDYILSPDICVERKGIADLFQSFSSGRLYNQVEQMLKHYSFAALLIEFQQDKSFSLQSRSELSSDIQLHNICSKLSLLMLEFPRLKLIWSRTPNATADIFKSIKINHDDPDVKKAVECGQGAATDDNRDAGATSKEARARDDARNILLSLPGVNNLNIHAIINNVENIASLSKMTAAQLEALVGPVNSKKLAQFFSQTPRR